MTKITVLGQEPKEKELKKIEFVGSIDYTGNVIYNPTLEPCNFDEIKVYLRTANQQFDLFVCYQDNIRFTYLGNFNDGIV